MSIDTSIHELEAVKRVCYAMSDRYSMRLERIDQTRISVTCSSMDGKALPPEFAREFDKAVIDYGIRVSLARQTAEIRDLIFRQAFVEADL